MPPAMPTAAGLGLGGRDIPTIGTGALQLCQLRVPLSLWHLSSEGFGWILSRSLLGSSLCSCQCTVASPTLRTCRPHRRAACRQRGGQREQAGAGCGADGCLQQGGNWSSSPPVPPSQGEGKMGLSPVTLAGWLGPLWSRGGSWRSLCKPPPGLRQDWHICSHPAASNSLLLPPSRGCCQPSSTDTGMGI